MKTRAEEATKTTREADRKMDRAVDKKRCMSLKTVFIQIILLVPLVFPVITIQA